MGRLSLYPDDGYFVNGTASPSHSDAVVLAMLRAGVRPYVVFEFESNYQSADLGKPERNETDWYSIGRAFAERFKPNSAFLVSEGVRDQGVVEWSAINEVDHLGAEEPELTYIQYRDMLKGLADGVHSSDPSAKVYPAGYLGPNRDQNYTAFGYPPGIAGLVNDGTLSGFDLHTYMDKLYAPLFNTYSRSYQSDFERCIAQSGITRVDIDLVSTEHNVKADPEASTQGYDEPTARHWFMTHLFDVQGAVRSDGAPATGVRLAWNMWRQSAEGYFMAASVNPRVPRWCGLTHKMLMDLLQEMSFVVNDPKATGTFKLTGGEKEVWAFRTFIQPGKIDSTQRSPLPIFPPGR